MRDVQELFPESSINWEVRLKLNKSVHVFLFVVCLLESFCINLEDFKSVEDRHFHSFIHH